MPKWMAFRPGYGIHALPSLGSASLRSKIRSYRDGEVPTSLFTDDVFWKEALSHIGIPVSHGCIRLLPDDAEFAFNFTPVGTRVVVHW